MSKRIFALLSLCMVAFSNNYAQKEINYINPPAVLSDGYAVSIDNIVSNDAASKLRVIVKNLNQDAFLVYNMLQSGFTFPNMGNSMKKSRKVK